MPWQPPLSSPFRHSSPFIPPPLNVPPPVQSPRHQFPPGSGQAWHTPPRTRRSPSWDERSLRGASNRRRYNPRPRRHSVGNDRGNNHDLGRSRTLRPSGGLLHPWLEGRAPLYDLWFDLSTSAFFPRRIVYPYSPGPPVALTRAELDSPATWPTVPYLCFYVNQYRIDVVANGRRMLSLGDVLMAIYQNMQLGITQPEYEALSRTTKMLVVNAYRMRCRAMGPTREQDELNRGVRRVDTLVGKVLFRGLVSDGRGIRAALF